MSAVYPVQSSFNKGELSPLLETRADIDFWRQALSLCRNWQVLTHGGLRRRSGTRFIAEVRDSSNVARLFPFKFSETQSYVLCLNGGFTRLFALRGTVGAPFEVAHAWLNVDLKRVSYTQFNDVAYFAHKAYQPRKLSRLADTNWTYAGAVFNDGPYLPEDTKGTKLTPASTGLLGSVIVSVSGTSTDMKEVVSIGVSDAYTITANANAAEAPSGWTLDGFDGTNWISLDSQSAQVGWAAGETRYFSFVNEIGFQKYRIFWTGNNGAANSGFTIALTQRGDTQTPFNLAASSTAGINNGAGFQASDVGRTVRLLGGDSKWRWARIISRVSTTVVTIRLYGFALFDTRPIARFQMGAFSTSSGWPGSVALYNERLMWARTDTKPVNVYGSKQGNFQEYGASDPLVSTDAINIELLSSNMNEVLWIADDEDLITGSAGQIRSIGPSDLTQSFSATNITQKKGPTSGASYLQPLSIGGITLYVANGGTKVRELVLGEQNRYVAPELSLISEHFFKAGIVDWAFAEKPDPTIYCATGDGLLVAITYDREQKALGFARHDVGGVVENVAVIPGVQAGYDDLYMVVRRTINGATKRYVEVLERPFDPETDNIADAFFVDCGLSYSGAAISTVTGLSHLNGANVIALADGGVVRGLTVSSGQITLPYAASKIHVGLPFTSRAETLPTAGPAQDGSLFGRRNNIVAVFADVYGTGSLKVGAKGTADWTPDLPEQILKEGDSLFGSPIDLQSGFKRCDIDGSWADGEGKIVVETDAPLPAILRSLVLQLENEP